MGSAVGEEHYRVESSFKQLCTTQQFDWSLRRGQGLTGHNQGRRLFAVYCPRGNGVWNYFGDLVKRKKTERGTQLTQEPPPLADWTHLASAGRTTIK